MCAHLRASYIRPTSWLQTLCLLHTCCFKEMKSCLLFLYLMLPSVDPPQVQKLKVSSFFSFRSLSLSLSLPPSFFLSFRLKLYLNLHLLINLFSFSGYLR
ncbi:hypothetical protein, unlikely [Trypanosoma brucei gambiense DAL972]|uniref:Uncharacterized protein n=1 Tax=Trypanosoma brucei gambiense (strain MHOM/CI/86/DAL972) TaxID=679716 RepID=D0A9B6_TRYB9|nr:hypothetical protein, unlikely [Trypanosoma brucei gambiense DAL972]CBH18267.1 hypothetical protein, unlikely [Trypanosoma brucei gambiense DAL972]|eukprot:XP_011780531.1 hypothetical protein, unlikely [Trypanosoma brucei gambiense DAL972]